MNLFCCLLFFFNKFFSFVTLDNKSFMVIPYDLQWKEVEKAVDLYSKKWKMDIRDILDILAQYNRPKATLTCTASLGFRRLYILMLGFIITRISNYNLTSELRTNGWPPGKSAVKLMGAIRTTILQSYIRTTILCWWVRSYQH